MNLNIHPTKLRKLDLSIFYIELSIAIIQFFRVSDYILFCEPITTKTSWTIVILVLVVGTDTELHTHALHHQPSCCSKTLKSGVKRV